MRLNEVIIYPKFTEKDIIDILKLNNGDRCVLSNKFVASKLSNGLIEIEVIEQDYEVDM